MESGSDVVEPRDRSMESYVLNGGKWTTKRWKTDKEGGGDDTRRNIVIALNGGKVLNGGNGS